MMIIHIQCYCTIFINGETKECEISLIRYGTASHFKKLNTSGFLILFKILSNSFLPDFNT